MPLTVESLTRQRRDDLFQRRRVLIALYLLGLLLRLPGLLWGDVHPDENISMSARALAGEIVPNQHFYPPLLNYLNAAAFAFMFCFGRIIGIWTSVAAFRDHYFIDPTPFYFTARLLTAVIGAATAPLAALIAHRLRAQWQGAALVGLAVTLLPAHVLLSHISKSDVAMTVALLLAVYFWLCHLDSREAPDRSISLRGCHLALGFSLALALSFKHSSLLLTTPLALALPAELLRRRTSLADVARQIAWIGFAAIVCWLPMNLGIVLDISGFLEFQRVQGQIAHRSPGLAATLAAFATMEANLSYGATIPGIVLFAIAPLLRRNAEILWLWLTILCGLSVALAIAGDRLRPELLLPYNVLMVCVGATALVTMRPRFPRSRIVQASAMSLLIGTCAWGALRVDLQAMQPSVKHRVAERLRTEISGNDQAKTLSAVDLGLFLEIDAQALEDSRQRDERLARRYDVELPQSAQNDQAAAHGGYYVRKFPWVIGGLEVYDKDEVEVVVPYAWPLQDEEWHLEYWTARGFTLFVTRNEQRYLTVDVPAYARFHRQIREECILLEELRTHRPLFWEDDMRVYRCARDGSG